MTQYIFDTTTNSSDLNLYVGGTPETVYHFENHVFTLSERPNVAVLSFPNFVDNVNEIGRWSAFILGYMEYNGDSFEDFNLDMEFKNGLLKCKLKIDNNMCINCSYDNITKSIVFEPRGELVVGHRDFGRFYEVLQSIATEIRRVY